VLQLPGRRQFVAGRRFPAANHGVEVHEIEESIAVVGPIVAAVLVALD
jgi:hypothetical protein